VKVLLVSFSYPPVSGPGLERTLELARSLPALGIETHVLAPEDDRRAQREEVARVPTQAWVHAHLVGLQPPGEAGPGRLRPLAARARSLGRQVLQPDESVAWNITGIPAAIRLVRRHRIDGVVTVAPPHSVHLIGVAVKRTTGVAWLADLGDPPGDGIAWLVTRQADAITCDSDAIAEAVRARGSGGKVVTVREDEDSNATADVLRSLK
jgi:hypothetical protein